MEVPGGHSAKMLVLIYEFVGTALLLVAVNYPAAESENVPYAVAIALFGIIMMIGPVSGGHVNPAVSTAVLVAQGASELGGNIIFFAMIVVS